MHKPIITTYCGLDCSLCDYKEPCQCGGCVGSLLNSVKSLGVER